MSQYIDLSHSLHSGMPVYPGTKPPVFRETSTLESDGFIEKSIEMYSHVGTHIDVPAHLFPNGKSIEEYNAGQFAGRALIIHTAANQPYSANDLVGKLKSVSEIDFVLFATGWDKFWGRPDYFESFPVPEEKVLKKIADLGITGVGIDTISIDRISDTHLPNHRMLLSNDIFILENLRNLLFMKQEVIDLFCFPLKIVRGDASPVRAVAKIH